MNNKIIIFTDSFPYGDYSESFFELELIYISKYFEEVIIYPLNKTSEKKRKVPTNVKVMEPLLKGKNHFLKKGLLNCYFNKRFIYEFFSEKVFLKKVFLKNFLLSVLTVRSILSDKDFNKMIFKEKNNETIKYFYWAKGFSTILPFLEETKNVVTRFHGFDLYKDRNDGYIPFRKKQLNNIQKRIFISNQGKEYLENEYPKNKSNHNHENILSYLGTNNSSKYFPIKNTSKLRIVSCSNLITLKRIDLIIKTLSLIKEINIEYFCIGTGSKEKELKELTITLPTNISVIFLGSLSNDEVITFYKDTFIDLFINVSSSEGIPVSIMEAMSFAIPTIATNVGGVSEIVNNENGYLIDENFSMILLKEIIISHSKLNNTMISKFKISAYETWSHNFNAEKNYTDFSKFLINTNKE